MDINKKINIVADYTYINESKCISKLTNKHDNSIVYRVDLTINKHKFTKLFNCLKKAQKYIDLKCIEHKREQLYNSFRMV